MNSLEKFKKKKDFLICIDSDGCAMDTMDIKHIKCFGPCMINQWNLEKWKSPILKRWNEVNLYTLTRGINRFKGLALALEEINERYIPVEGLNEFIGWTHSTKELSNESLEGQIKIQKQNITCLKKALDWSRAVNASINELKDEIKFSLDREINLKIMPILKSLQGFENVIESFQNEQENRLSNLEQKAQNMSKLTPDFVNEEQKIIELFHQGKSVEQIAKDLRISTGNVEFTLKMKELL